MTALRIFVDAIPKVKLKTGIEKKPKKTKAFEVLKEDKQAFGLLVTTSVTMEESFSYPITSLPLPIAITSGGLIRSDQSQLRKTLIDDSMSNTSVTPL